MFFINSPEDSCCIECKEVEDISRSMEMCRIERAEERKEKILEELNSIYFNPISVEKQLCSRKVSYSSSTNQSRLSRDSCQKNFIPDICCPIPRKSHGFDFSSLDGESKWQKSTHIRSSFGKVTEPRFAHLNDQPSFRELHSVCLANIEEIPCTNLTNLYGESKWLKSSRSRSRFEEVSEPKFAHLNYQLVSRANSSFGRTNIAEALGANMTRLRGEPKWQKSAHIQSRFEEVSEPRFVHLNDQSPCREFCVICANNMSLCDESKSQKSSSSRSRFGEVLRSRFNCLKKSKILNYLSFGRTKKEKVTDIKLSRARDQLKSQIVPSPTQPEYDYDEEPKCTCLNYASALKTFPSTIQSRNVKMTHPRHTQTSPPSRQRMSFKEYLV